ncbi:DUF1837 domain-containing protein [Paenibacillus peoriae]|uniref:DUF1837 domain-containing protein n=1 Tax=Paenibacillus peoriae TaxID=59893 RepID=UPI000B269914|nr:DUF1837 domain-containing protein [Paenibacillus peoriae]
MGTAAVIKGIRFLRKTGYAICHIDKFSKEMGDVLREQLSSVCYGSSKAESSRKAYTYRKTLKEFLERYESKAPDTQMGMIGELLTHILVFKYFSEFNAVSPYFNLEERSIKKGFDVVLYSRGENELWITEVKSGELHKNKNANETTASLLGTAKRDLQKRLNENEISLWENAINGAKSVLEDKRDVKDAVIEILYNFEDDVADENAISTNKNVILVASLFSCLSDEIKELEVKKFSDKVIKTKTFRDVIVFTFQKETHQRIVDFLKSEAAS